MSEYQLPDRNRIIAELYAFKLGIAPCLDGFDRFVDAVLAVAFSEQPRSLDSVYKQLSQKYSVKYKSVSRSVTYALYGAHNLCKTLGEIIGYPVKPQNITAKFVICNIAKRVRNDADEEAPAILVRHFDALDNPDKFFAKLQSDQEEKDFR